MRDPIAPPKDDPYCVLNLPFDATLADAENAMDRYDQSNPGREMESTAAWDKLRDPAERLAIDIYRYHHAKGLTEPAPTSRADIDVVRKHIVGEINKLKAAIDFEKPKIVVPVELKKLSPGGGNATSSPEGGV